MIAITWKINPDLDAVACAIAYEYYFKQQWVIDKTAIFQWNPHSEAKFVCRELWINVDKRIKEEFDGWIMVDFSQKFWLPDFIDPISIVEVIDHRLYPDYDFFPNAQFQIELVWSATTLIAEKFQFNNIWISPEMASLLYCWTLSNTLNFKANVTTFRDHRSAEWLISQWANIELWQRMFNYNAQYILNNLEDVILENNKIRILPNWESIDMIQLELLDGWFLYTKGDICKELRERGLLDVVHAIIIVQDHQLWRTRIFVEDWLKKLFIHRWFEWKLVDEFRWEMPKLYLRKELIPMINKLCI